MTLRLCRSDRRIAGGSCSSGGLIRPTGSIRPRYSGQLSVMMPIGNSFQLLHFPRLAGFRDGR